MLPRRRRPHPVLPLALDARAAELAALAAEQDLVLRFAGNDDKDRITDGKGDMAFQAKKEKKEQTSKKERGG